MVELKLSHIEVEDIKGKPVSVLGEIAAEADAVKTAVQTELLRQAEEAQSVLRATGYEDGSLATPDRPRRGRRTNAERAATATPNGHSEEDENALDAE